MPLDCWAAVGQTARTAGGSRSVAQSAASASRPETGLPAARANCPVCAAETAQYARIGAANAAARATSAAAARLRVRRPDGQAASTR